MSEDHVLWSSGDRVVNVRLFGDLREKLALTLCEADCGEITENELERCRGLADAVLALPEMEALRLERVKYLNK